MAAAEEAAVGRGAAADGAVLAVPASLADAGAVLALAVRLASPITGSGSTA